MRAARHFVQDVLTGTDDCLRNTVLLLTSEVATNAMLHAGRKFDVSVEYIENGGVRVSVTDDSTQMPQPRVTPVDAITGRGLSLVEALASAWGGTGHRNGKVVWFEIGVTRRDR